MVNRESVIEWPDDEGKNSSYERIICIDGVRGNTLLISLPSEASTGKLKKPRIRQASMGEMRRAILSRTALKLPVHQFDPDPVRDVRAPLASVSLVYRLMPVLDHLVQLEPDIYYHLNHSIREAADQSGLRPSVIKEALMKYLQGGKNPEALYRRYFLCGNGGERRTAEEGASKRGRPRRSGNEGVNVTEAVLGIFEASYKKHVRSPWNSLGNSYLEMLETRFKKGFRIENGIRIPVLPPAEELPSWGQYKYHYYQWKKRRKPSEILIGREGEHEFETNRRGFIGTERNMAHGPGHMYLHDATPVDVPVMSSWDPRAQIKDPHISLELDLFSSIIPGVYITSGKPDVSSGKMTIFNSNMDKVKLCAEHGVPIQRDQWPCAGLPKIVLGDRGELVADGSQPIVTGAGTRIYTTPAGRPDKKGSIETGHYQINRKLRRYLFLPIKTNLRKAIKKEYKRAKILTLDRLYQIVFQVILHYNKTHWIDNYPMTEDMNKDNVKPVPDELWKWGVQNRGGYLRERDENRLKLDLLVAGFATVTPAGIIHNGVPYTNDRVKKEEWTVKARNSGNYEVEIRHDPRRAKSIYVVHRSRNKTTLEPAYMRPDFAERLNGYSDLDLVAHFDFMGVEKEQFQTEVLRSTARTNSINKATIKAAQKDKKEFEEKAAGIPVTSSQEATKRERARLNDKEAFTPPLPDIGATGGRVSSAVKSKQDSLLEIAIKSTEKEEQDNE